MQGVAGRAGAQARSGRERRGARTWPGRRVARAAGGSPICTLPSTIALARDLEPLDRDDDTQSHTHHIGKLHTYTCGTCTSGRARRARALPPPCAPPCAPPTTRHDSRHDSPARGRVRADRCRRGPRTAQPGQSSHGRGPGGLADAGRTQSQIAHPSPAPTDHSMGHSPAP